MLQVFCFAAFWMGLGLITLPMFLPLLAIEREISSIMLAVIMTLPSIFQFLATPILNRYYS